MKNLHVPSSGKKKKKGKFVEDRSLVGQQEAGMPAKQPKGSSTGTRSTLDTGGQPVGGRAAA